MDVARCIYEANLIEGDILPILSKWPDDALENRFKARIALSCFEVMVPLTWPIDKDRERMTVNHHRHVPVLELAQIQYKKAIINFDHTRILNMAVRSALPPMAIPAGDRSTRDQGIVKLVLFFLRNMAMITPSPDSKYDGDESQISRSATIDAFSYQDIFLFLLTLSSNMGEDFRTEDTTVMEIIYHLVKRVNIDRLFMDDNQRSKAQASELSTMMNKEAAMLNSYNRHGPTRHSRFGTMVWVKRDDGKMSSLSGQDALGDAATRFKKLDDSKTFRPPRRGKKDDKDERDLGLPTPLTASATRQLRSFVQDFLDSGFNPLFVHLRRTIDREASHVMQFHRRQFFYLVGWFLEAERVRRRNGRAAGSKNAQEVSSFNLVAGVLNQEMFITLNKALHESYDMKDRFECAAVMRCFTQILLTVQEMVEQGSEDDQEIANNVLSRLFYEEATHDVIVNIAKNYKDQGFEYLDASTELVHHFLRTLEAYSKQNVDMQVRSRRLARQKKRAATSNQDEDGDNVDENEDSGEDEAAAERTSKERKFDFHRFANKFSPQGVVNTFVKFTKFYKDLNAAQLKRAHRYFYRMAFKQELSVMLFRVDIIHLLHNMIKGPDALEKSNSMFKDWEELVKQILRKCFKKLDERPELLVEMLFSKLHGTAFFLEYGHEKQTSSTSKAKPAAELVFKHTEERDRQIAIAVGALLDKNEQGHIEWVKEILMEVDSERQAWEKAEEAYQAERDPFEEEVSERPKEPPVFSKQTFFRTIKVCTNFLCLDIKADSKERKTAMFKNSFLRLLMTLSGIQRNGLADEETQESQWTIPSDTAHEYLKDSLHFIRQAEWYPPTFDDGSTAEQQLKRKTAPRKKAAFDDDNDDGDDVADFLDDGQLFPAGGPTARKVIDETDKPKKTRRRRRRSGSQDGPDDEVLEERARKRRDREREKLAKIKSALYVKDGDDEFDSEEDEAFFARERAIKARAEAVAQSVATDVDDIEAAIGMPAPRKSAKRKSGFLSDDEDDDGSDVSDKDGGAASNDGDDDLIASHSRSSSQAIDNASETEDTPMQGVQEDTRGKRRRLSDKENAGLDESVADDVEGEATTETLPRRPRVRGGFVIDSDDDE